MHFAFDERNHGQSPDVIHSERDASPTGQKERLPQAESHKQGESLKGLLSLVRTVVSLQNLAVGGRNVVSEVLGDHTVNGHEASNAVWRGGSGNDHRVVGVVEPGPQEGARDGPRSLCQEEMNATECCEDCLVHTQPRGALCLSETKPPKIEREKACTRREGTQCSSPCLPESVRP